MTTVPLHSSIGLPRGNTFDFVGGGREIVGEKTSDALSKSGVAAQDSAWTAHCDWPASGVAIDGEKVKGLDSFVFLFPSSSSSPLAPLVTDSDKQASNDLPRPGRPRRAQIVCRRIAPRYDVDPGPATIFDQARNDDLRLLTLE